MYNCEYYFRFRVVKSSPAITYGSISEVVHESKKKLELYTLY